MFDRPDRLPLRTQSLSLETSQGSRSLILGTLPVLGGRIQRAVLPCWACLLQRFCAGRFSAALRNRLPATVTSHPLSVWSHRAGTASSPCQAAGRGTPSPRPDTRYPLARSEKFQLIPRHAQTPGLALVERQPQAFHNAPDC